MVNLPNSRTVAGNILSPEALRTPTMRQTSVQTMPVMLPERPIEPHYQGMSEIKIGSLISPTMRQTTMHTTPVVLPERPIEPHYQRMPEIKTGLAPTERLAVIPSLPGVLRVKETPMPKIEMVDFRSVPGIIVLPQPLVPKLQKMPKIYAEEPPEIRLEKIYPELQLKDIRGLSTSTSIFMGNIGASSGRCFGEIGKLY